jgi:hypothetical protein
MQFMYYNSVQRACPVSKQIRHAANGFPTTEGVDTSALVAYAQAIGATQCLVWGVRIQKKNSKDIGG